jgi:hypothetical protein
VTVAASIHFRATIFGGEWEFRLDLGDHGYTVLASPSEIAHLDVGTAAVPFVVEHGLRKHGATDREVDIARAFFRELQRGLAQRSESNDGG